MSLEKALDILELYNFDHTTYSVAEMAEKLNQPQSSVYRHLKVLKNRGYIREDKEDMYKLGYKILYFSKIIRDDTNLLHVTREEMIRLRDATKETIILSIRSGYHAVCLDTISSLQPINVSSKQGAIVPIHCGASSKVLLAYMDEKFIDQLYELNVVERYTENTICDREELLKELEDIRRKGYAYSESEIDWGVSTYSVPIFDFNGSLITSLSVAFPSERIKDIDSQFLIHQLKESASNIEKYL
ncbi:IclR family transcriptional regulator [Niallia nealsonii]|uniref:IclR family transcriptional regulator n=1 Tax=Niallia nealsonii TaxID=115979 RepID=A0A2N0Z5J2_9BACI|nr:IclR family transcriptional regulator [Niallia nealsonii]PKG24770.1 hypothetical protein CWS01_05855 [Niallia nealsonii]